MLGGGRGGSEGQQRARRDARVGEKRARREERRLCGVCAGASAATHGGAGELAVLGEGMRVDGGASAGASDHWRVRDARTRARARVRMRALRAGRALWGRAGAVVVAVAVVVQANNTGRKACGGVQMGCE